MPFRTAIDAGIAEAAAQKERLFLWAPVAFGAGIAAYYAWPFEPGMMPIAVAVLLLSAGVFVMRTRRADSAGMFLAFVAVAGLAIAALGFLDAKLSLERDGTPILAKGVGPVTVTGDVAQVETLGGKKGSRVLLSNLAIEDVAAQDTPRKIRLTFRKDDGLAPGQRIETLARIDPPSGPVAPGAYDFRRHLFFEGIGGVGFAYRAGKVVAESGASGPSAPFERMREAIDDRVRAGTGAATGGIATALITGERGGIAEEDNDAMRDSGLYHLLSISGTHVSMVAGVIFMIVRLGLAAWPWAALRWPVKKIAAVVALLGAAFYVVLAGSDVPAQRSLMMTGLVLFAIMVDRSPFSLRLIAFSALAVMAIAPHAILGVSFQMSFAAVAALICFYEATRGWWTAWRARAGWVRKGLLYLMALLVTSLIAGASTGLFSLYHFQAFQFYGVLSNMIAVPLTGVVIMPAVVLALILMPFGLEALPLQIMDWGIVWMLAVAHWTAGLDGAVVHAAQWPHATFVLMSAAVILFLLWQGWRGEAVAGLLLAAGLIIAIQAARPDVMMNGKGGLVGVVGEDGTLYVSSGRKDRFAAENWMRRTGQGAGKPETFAAKGAPMLCDDDGCRMVRRGVKVGLPKTQKGYREDCGWADVIVGEGVLDRKACPEGPRVLSLYDVKKNGAMAIFIDDTKRIEVRFANDGGGRPWMPGYGRE